MTTHEATGGAVSGEPMANALFDTKALLDGLEAQIRLLVRDEELSDGTGDRLARLLRVASRRIEDEADALLDLVLIPRQSAPAAGTGEGAA